MQSQTKESCCEKASLHPGCWFTHRGHGYRCRNSSVPRGLGYSPIWLWFCHQRHMLKDLGGVTPTHALGNRHTDFSPGCRHWGGQWTVSKTLLLLAGVQQSLKISLPNLVKVQILKQPYNWTLAHPSSSLWTVLLAQGPVRRHSHLWPGDPEKALYAALAHPAMAIEQSSPPRDLVGDRVVHASTARDILCSLLFLHPIATW